MTFFQQTSFFNNITASYDSLSPHTFVKQIISKSSNKANARLWFSATQMKEDGDDVFKLKLHFLDEHVVPVVASILMGMAILYILLWGGSPKS